jgi:hypothetical protein
MVGFSEGGLLEKEGKLSPSRHIEKGRGRGVVGVRLGVVAVEYEGFGGRSDN